MTGTAQMLRPTEAAVVSGVDLRDVNHAIDRKLLPEDAVVRRPGRRVSAAGCFFLNFYHGSAERLTAQERLSAIREANRRLDGRPIETAWVSSIDDWVVRDAFLQIDFEPFVVSTAERWERYRRAQANVSSSADTLGGMLVIRGTRVPVYDVAASVAAGHSVEELLQAYYRLTAEQVEMAVLYAQANPAPGRRRMSAMPAGATLISEKRVSLRRTPNEPLH